MGYGVAGVKRWPFVRAFKVREMGMGELYPKIESPYMRHTEGPSRNKLDATRWSRPEFDILANQDWVWTEKVDGTNIRVIWDGYRVTFGGRTDNAQIPAKLVAVLTNMFPEELLEQHFKQNPAVLYGEGFGPGIQKGGGNYGPAQSFVLFDVKVGDWWLLPDSVNEIGAQMSVAVVPQVFVGSVNEAIARVTSGHMSQWGPFLSEGLVGRPPLGLRARNGDRMLMKVKTVDFAPRS